MVVSMLLQIYCPTWVLACVPMEKARQQACKVLSLPKETRTAWGIGPSQCKRSHTREQVTPAEVALASRIRAGPSQGGWEATLNLAKQCWQRKACSHSIWEDLNLRICRS